MSEFATVREAYESILPLIEETKLVVADKSKTAREVAQDIRLVRKGQSRYAPSATTHRTKPHTMQLSDGTETTVSLAIVDLMWPEASRGQGSVVVRHTQPPTEQRASRPIESELSTNGSAWSTLYGKKDKSSLRSEVSSQGLEVYANPTEFLDDYVFRMRRTVRAAHFASAMVHACGRLFEVSELEPAQVAEVDADLLARWNMVGGPAEEPAHEDYRLPLLIAQLDIPSPDPNA